MINKDNIYLNSTVFKSDNPYFQCDFDTFINFHGDRMYKYISETGVLEVYEY